SAPGPTGTNSDGASPYGGLVLSGHTLYGTTSGGGSSTVGTVFSMNTDGTGFRTLHNFSGEEGANPFAGLILSGDTLYGTTTFGGVSGNGVVFAMKIDGTGFAKLHEFSEGNIDGSNPFAALILSGNTLYGTTAYGGVSG